MATRAKSICRAVGCGALVAMPGYCAKHQQQAAGWHRTSTASHAERYGPGWWKLRAQILKRDNHLCQPCAKLGRPTLATEVDHIVNKKAGGSDDPANLQAICKPCHKAKTARESGRLRYVARR